MDERKLEQLFSHDFSAGTEAFRDKLLEQCLAAMDDEDGIAPLSDSELELLAAAGTPFQNSCPPCGTNSGDPVS